LNFVANDLTDLMSAGEGGSTEVLVERSQWEETWAMAV